MKSILIINEDLREANQIKQIFTNDYTRVFCVESMQKALEVFISTELCLIILDACLSSEDEHKLLRAMRRARTTPILVLSSKTDHQDRLNSLKAGAHAYMGKPYSLEECFAQAQSLINMYVDTNPHQQKGYTLAFGKDLLIDPDSRKVFLKGNELHLTKTEFNLLLCFASNPGRVFSREQLYNLLWDEQTAYNVDDIIKAHIKRLHSKLSESQVEYIKSVWGIGYRFRQEIDK